ncbi:MAG TPA: hypothetical protein ENG66_07455 [Thermococcus sp.]|nr:hypothetical protein [Thermococcus sp.]
MKLTKQQRVVYDSIPKGVFKLPPEKFAEEFVKRVISHPIVQEKLKGNEFVETKMKEVLLEVIQEEIMK